MINLRVIKSVDNMKLNQYFLCIVMSTLSSCTWVETTKEGSEVLLVKSYNVQSCQHLGSTKATVKHEIGPVTRSEDKVTEELVTLAKNHAADMGGDSIVAAGPMTDGSMTFDVYRCGDST
jgi:sulfatase maturation enzyme AslB (radical SAM superfamily)